MTIADRAAALNTCERASFTRERALNTRERASFTREPALNTRERAPFTRQPALNTRESAPFTRERSPHGRARERDMCDIHGVTPIAGNRELAAQV